MDDLEQILRQLGLTQSGSVSTTMPGMPGMSGMGSMGITKVERPAAPPLMAEGMGGGFKRQLIIGLNQPLTIIPRKLGLMPDVEQPKPYTTGEKIGNIMGSLIGGGLLVMLTGATLGKGTLALSAGMVAKGGLAASALKGGAVFSTTSALYAWDKDLPPGEIAKQAGYGAAMGVAFPLLGAATLGMRTDAMNTLKRAYTALETRAYPGLTQQIYGKEAMRGWVKGMSWKQATGIVEKLPKPVRAKMPSLSPQEQLSQMLKGLSDERGASQLIRPVMREFIPSAFRTRHIAMTKNGVPYSQLHMFNIGLLGRTKGDPAVAKYLKGTGIEEIKPPAGFGKAPLQKQIDWIDGKIKRRLTRMDELREKGSVVSFDQLPEAKMTAYQKLVGQVDELQYARYRLMPKVDEVVLGVKKGVYPKALDKTLEEASATMMKKTAVEAKYPTHEKLLAIMKRDGAWFPEQLKGKAAKEYWLTKNHLEGLGQVTTERHGWIHNLDMFPKGLGQFARKAALGFPDVKVPTSFDEALRFKPPGLWEALLTPKRGVFGEAITRNFRTGLSQQRDFEANWGNKIEGTLKGVSKENREVIARWIWAPDKKAFETNLAKSGIKWTSTLRTTARKVDAMFEQLGPITGVSKKHLIENYAPRLKDGKFILEQTKDKLPHTLKYFAQEQRTGYLYPKETDIKTLLHAYVHAGARKTYLDPAFKVADRTWAPAEYVKRLREEARRFLQDKGVKRPKDLGKEDIAAYKGLVKAWQKARTERPALEVGLDKGRADLYESVKRSLLGWPTETEQQVNTTLSSLAKILYGSDTKNQFSKEIISWLTMAQYNATLGWNAFSPIKNLTQQILPVAHLDNNPLVGVKYWAKAYKYLLSQEGRNLSAMTNQVLPNRMHSQAVAYQDKSIQAIRPAIQKFSELGFTAFRGADKLNVSVSHMMKLLYDLDKGVPFGAAVERAYSFTMATQFMYGFDSPMLYMGSLGRVFGTLMSWPLNYANLIKEQAGGAAAQKAANMIALGVIGAEALSATGMSFRSIHPLETASGMLPIAMLEGQDRMPVTLRAIGATGSYLRALGDGDAEATAWAFENFKRAVVQTHVPAWSQIKRGAELVDTLKNDYTKYDQRDRLRYEVGKREAWTGLFGPTIESRQRWEHQQLVKGSISSYQRLRRQAMEALFDGDIEMFLRKQDDLVLYFGKGIEAHEAKQELLMREMPALERQAIGLPEATRIPLLERLQ